MSKKAAVEVGVHVDTVRTGRGRFADLGLPGLADRKRPGRPAAFTALQGARVKAPACRLPAEAGAPLSRWPCPELAREAVERGIAPFLSASTVRRRLDQDAIKPRCVRPHLGRRAARRGRVRDQRISADEKTSIQARCRCHPNPYLAAYDVHQATGFGREPTVAVFLHSFAPPPHAGLPEPTAQAPVRPVTFSRYSFLLSGLWSVRGRSGTVPWATGA